jgi:CheY-like chemotaxis protein
MKTMTTMKRILLVDDEVALTKMLKRNLEGTQRFAVQEVNDGLQAVAAAREYRPDLIILDVMMPGIDGGEVAAQLAADDTTRAIPIVFLTAIVSREDVPAAGGTIGGRIFLAKPVRFADLLACIDSHLTE